MILLSAKGARVAEGGKVDVGKVGSGVEGVFRLVSGGGAAGPSAHAGASDVLLVGPLIVVEFLQEEDIFGEGLVLHNYRYYRVFQGVPHTLFQGTPLCCFVVLEFTDDAV